MFNRNQAPAKMPSQQPVQPKATPQVASRQLTTPNPLSVQRSSSPLNVRPPDLSAIPPMPLTSPDDLKKGFVLSVGNDARTLKQYPGGPVVTAIMGSVQPRGANVRASLPRSGAPRDPEPGALKKAAQSFSERLGKGKGIAGGLERLTPEPITQKKAAQSFSERLGKSFSSGRERLANLLRRPQSSPAVGPKRPLVVSAPTLVAAPVRRFNQQDVLLRVDGAIKGAQLAENDLGNLNLDSAPLDVAHLATGNGAFRRLATALKTGSQLISNDHDYDVPDALKEPLKAIADFYKRPEVTRHLIPAGDESGWARNGDGKIDVPTLRGLANEGLELLRLLGEAKDSLAPTGTGERPRP